MNILDKITIAIASLTSSFSLLISDNLLGFLGILVAALTFLRNSWFQYRSIKLSEKELELEQRKNRL